MPDVQRELAALAMDLEWPETPDLAAALPQRLEPPRGRPGGARRRRRRVLVAVAAAALALPAGALAVPGARDAVLRWLGLRHVTVERRNPPPRTTTRGLGERLPLAVAARRAGLTPLVPPALDGAAAYERDGRLSLTRAGLLLEQRRGGLDEPMLRKIVAVASDVERVDVGGRPGLWLATPHAYLWVTPRGDIVEQRPVRSGPALVWERGGRVLRLEGARLTRARALRIARAAR